MSRIMLGDLLTFDNEELARIKIKFNKHNGNENPLELYKQTPEKVNTTWFLHHEPQQHRWVREGDTAICLLRIVGDTWLLTCVKRITALRDVPAEGGVGYDAVEDERFEKYFGRVLVRYHNTQRTMTRRYASLRNELEVVEVLGDRFSGYEFPGYENVRLNYGQLKTVIGLREWIAALQNQKAVYLITDTCTGKLYVGSATAQYGMLLQRWTSYVKNGHGGNVALKAIVETEGIGYVERYFQYAVLENYNARIDDGYVLQRESWWKDTLKSREFGLNEN